MMKMTIYEIKKNLRNGIGRLAGFHKFITIGALVTLISLSSNTILLAYFKTPLIPTYIFVYLSTIVLSFYLNSRFTFKSAITLRNLSLYVVIYLSGMGLGVLLLATWQYLIRLENWVYPFLVIPFTLLWNFLVSKKMLS